MLESKLNFTFYYNEPITRSFSRELLDVEMSDYYRLQVLYEKGGLYLDFDSYIDEKCLE